LRKYSPGGGNPPNLLPIGYALFSLSGVLFAVYLAREVRSAQVSAPPAAQLVPLNADTPATPDGPDEPDEAPRVTREAMSLLARELRQMAGRAPAARAAVYVQDVGTGFTASVNGEQPFVAASLMKLPVMAAAYRLWERRPELKTPRARAWMEEMIAASDNASTDRLIDMVGGPEVVTRLSMARGWPGLKTRHAILNHRGRRGRNLVTARDVTRLLAALDRRRLVSPEADEEMWEILQRQQIRGRIPAGLPDHPEVLVGSKTGTLGFVLHDAGIVRTPAARYALCILLANQRSDAAGERFCRDVSRVVFEHMHRGYAAVGGRRSAAAGG
jgi:beta-lactamase class A